MGLLYQIAASLVLLLAAATTNAALAKPPLPLRLSLPLACVPQKTCFVQNYVDVDPGRGVQDYSCHKASYDGHKGVDFRIPSIALMQQGVDVLAPAAGRVKALRDGMTDRLISKKNAASIKGRECGNGLVLDHGEGWETQLCHMRRGSLQVKKGQQVKRGQKLGLVGLSGNSAFPHVHLSVRHHGKLVDPFGGATTNKKACTPGKAENMLWQTELARRLPYVSGQLFSLGFAAQPVKKRALMRSGPLPRPQSIKTRALVFYALVLNLEKGDQLRISINGPAGQLVSQTTPPMNQHKADYLLFAGKKRHGKTWPAGNYNGSLALLRGGKPVWQQMRMIELD